MIKPTDLLIFSIQVCYPVRHWSTRISYLEKGDVNMPIDQEEFLKKMKEQFDELNYRWNIERNKFEAKAQQATSEAKKKFEDEIEELQKLRAIMKEKIVDLEVASENAWEEVKEGSESAWKELSKAFKKAVSHFK